MRVLNGHLGGRQVLLVDSEKSEKYVERVYRCQTFAMRFCVDDILLFVEGGDATFFILMSISSPFLLLSLIFLYSTSNSVKSLKLSL